MKPQHPNKFKNNFYASNGKGAMQQNLKRRHNPGFHAPLPWNNHEANRRGGWLETESRGGDEYSCETCDRGFPSLQLLEKHKMLHQKCNIDGCQFVAHPKVITKHIQMQHSSGLFKRIAKLDNPEAINKWREERKKKYPTKQNIDKKAAELKAKVDRGEKMGLQSDRFSRNANSVPGGAKSNHNMVNNYRQHQTDFQKKNLIGSYKKPKKEVKSIPEIDKNSILKPFTGIQNITMDCDFEEKEEVSKCNFLIEDDDCEALTRKMSKTENIEDPVICGALSSLICEYGSSDEESNKLLSSETSQPIKALENTTKTTLNRINNKLESDEDSGPEEATVMKNNIIDDKLENRHDKQSFGDKRKHSKMKKKIFMQSKVLRSKPKLPSTLLHKLLYKEMRQERNLVLQCIRYIREKNFFDQ